STLFPYTTLFRSPRDLPPGRRDHRPPLDRQLLLQRLERGVGAGLAQLVDRVVAGCDPDRTGAGAVARLDVERCVTNNQRAAGVYGATQDGARALDRLPRQLGPVLRVRAIAAEREVVV